MSGTVTYTRSLVTEECYKCGMVFGMPQDFQARALRLKGGTSFFCPAGHEQHYTGKSYAQEKRELEERAEIERKNAEFWREQKRASERRAAAARGATTKLKKRIANGVCPCCKRTFANVARHMDSQHPAWVEEEQKARAEIARTTSKAGTRADG